MKKLKYVILLFCLTITLIGCTKKEAEQAPESTSTPLLLEVTKEGMDNKLYLFGSIHAGEKTMYPLPDYIINAYKESDILAVEFDLVEYSSDIANQMELLSKFIIPDGKKITDYVDEKTYHSGVSILENLGLYSPMYDSYSPIMWQTLIETAAMEEVNLSSAYGIDTYMLELAKEDGKKILELESAEYQYNVLLGFDEETQIYLLKQSIEEHENSKENLKELYELYKKGNKEELEKLVFQSEEEPNQYEIEYNEKLITIRNNNMTDLLEKNFQEGKNVFCTVGLAHIIGKGGMIDQFEQRGYTVRVVK